MLLLLSTLNLCILYLWLSRFLSRLATLVLVCFCISLSVAELHPEVICMLVQDR